MKTTRHNKTYRQRPTQHHKQQANKKLAISIILASAMTLAAINSLADYIKHNSQTTPSQPQATTSQTKPYQVINLQTTTNNAITAYKAITAACDKHLPATTYGQEINYNCITDLLSIAHQENRDFNFQSIGYDGYKSYGLFQISLHYHPNLTLSQLIDPYFSADWTLSRLIANDYLTNRDNAIRKHNGSITNPKTLVYLSGVNNYKNLLAN